MPITIKSLEQFGTSGRVSFLCQPIAADSKVKWAEELLCTSLLCDSDVKSVLSVYGWVIRFNSIYVY